MCRQEYAVEAHRPRRFAAIGRAKTLASLQQKATWRSRPRKSGLTIATANGRNGRDQGQPIEI
jgi:hypothetical protein